MIVDVMAGRRIDVPARARAQSGCDQCATRSMCVLGSLDAQRRRALEPAVRKFAFRPGDTLVHQGERASALCVIQVGTVFGCRAGLDGAARPVGMWGRGAGFGLCGFFGQITQLAAVAAGAGRACAIPVQALQDEARRSPLVFERMTTAMIRNYGTMAAWSEAKRLPGTANQLGYAILLLADLQRSAAVELPSQKALAALLGTTRETIARALATLEREGAIRRSGRRNCEVVRSQVLDLITRTGASPEIKIFSDDADLPA
jgi:CRP-like cAMP-binding protein